MANSLLRHAGVITFAAAVACAQAPSSSPPPGATSTQPGRQDIVSRHLEKLAQVFDLTEPQKEQARTIFEQAELSAQPIHQQAQQNLDELAAAAEASKSEGDIQKLAQEQGRLWGQLLAIRTQSWSKFYQMLTPEQRAKTDRADEQQKAPPGEHKNGP